MIYRYQEQTTLGTVTVYLPTKEIPSEWQAAEMLRKAIDQTYEAGEEEDLPLMYDQGLIGRMTGPTLDKWKVKEMQENEELRDALAEELLNGTKQGDWLAHMEKNPELLQEQDNLDYPEEDEELRATLTPLNLSPEEEEELLNPTLQEMLLERMPSGAW